jgi:hypothetical protein
MKTHWIEQLNETTRTYNHALTGRGAWYAALKCTHLSVRSSSLVAKAPNRITDNRYIAVVVRVADRVPTGIERCVSFSTADRFEPAIIPVIAGKKRPTKAL